MRLKVIHQAHEKHEMTRNMVPALVRKNDFQVKPKITRKYDDKNATGHYRPAAFQFF